MYLSFLVEYPVSWLEFVNLWADLGQKESDNKHLSIKFYKLITFFLTMAQGGVSQAQFKRDLEQLGNDLSNIDLQIQGVKQGMQQGNLVTLEAARTQIAQEVVAKEVELTQLKAQARANNVIIVHEGIFSQPRFRSFCFWNP